MLHSIFNYVGLAILLHAAYSFKHYRSLIEATAVDAPQYPIDVSNLSLCMYLTLILLYISF